MNTFIEPPKRRALQKTETRARILEAARAAFEREGFEGANVREIAADAGVAAGTVLLHFEDKRDLMHAALFDELAALIRDVVARPRRGSLGSQLRALAAAFFGYYAERPKLSKTLLREALLAEAPWRERFVAQVARVHVHVVALVEEAKARGEIAARASPDLVAASFFSFYYFALIGWVQGALPSPHGLFEKLLAEHLAGLAPAPRARRKR